ncbi:DUF4407 domain-containing protein [Planktothrix mougeotii]|uniref:DUF4407 domain-containing protein n=1 Tax=Planktothrix mougeotii LEGE 06226 TaxID=1828728 RepID=A0ABR9U708_9CYAN|nr:DUF4407 domain-containing protein [Planktothrix mougeotii]MBE9142238.1 DUF4407 domain-containing protein [Planktothrix mougeotii LEGE 06226]
MGLAVLQTDWVSPKVDIKPMQNQKRDTKTSSPVQRIFWQCAGANEEILKKEQCATDRAKYASIGAIVLFISTLASFSMGYAIFVVFENIILSVVLGLLWGWGIRSLDRLFIISIKKKYRANFGEYLVGSVVQTITALPRLGLALVLGLVISKPLEIQIFNKELEAEIAKVNEVEIKNLRKKLYDDEMRALDIEKKRLENDIKLENEKRDKAHNEYICETRGTCGTGKPNEGPVALEIKKEVKRIDENIAKLGRQQQEVQQKIDEANNRLNKKIQQLKSKDDGADGLLKRIKTLENLGRVDPDIANINFFVTLIFILLETSPIFVKILSGYGPYDAIIEREELKTVGGTARGIKEAKHELELLDKLLKDKGMIRYEIYHLKKIKKIELKGNVDEAQRAQDTFDEIQEKVWETLQKQLNQILAEMAKDQGENLLEIRSKILIKMEKKIEEQLLQFTDEISLTGKELHEMLNKVKTDLLQEALSNRVRGITNEKIVQEVEQQVEEFKAQGFQIKQEINNENNGSNHKSN